MGQHTKKSYKKGEVIMRQGDEGLSAFIIEAGRVAITVEQPDGKMFHVGDRGEGSIIGEMSIVDDAPRTATVTAIEDCKMLEISKDDFTSRLEATDPVIQTISHVILARYRDMLKRAEIFGEEKRFPPPESLEKKVSGSDDIIESIRINNELELAIENNDLYLNYQPLVDLKTGQVIGAEALVRWQHPDMGFVSPGLFIPVAEKSGLILDITQWVVDAAASGLQRMLAREHEKLKDVYISVNFSSYDFNDPNFVDKLFNVAYEHKIKPEQLTLEITERILIQQPDKAKKVLTECRKHGMKVALDDFGTGYSSLSYLHYFPLDILKVDQSFVQEIDHDDRSFELVKSIITLGSNLGLKTIAEGVETGGQAKKLIEAGCDAVQGYFYARPMPEDEFVDAIKDWSPPNLD